MNFTTLFLTGTTLIATAMMSLAAATEKSAAIPDFTQGDAIPEKVAQ